MLYDYSLPLADVGYVPACIWHVLAFMIMQSVMIFGHVSNLIINDDHSNRNTNKTGESCPHTHSRN